MAVKWDSAAYHAHAILKLVDALIYTWLLLLVLHVIGAWRVNACFSKQ